MKTSHFLGFPKFKASLLKIHYISFFENLIHKYNRILSHSPIGLYLSLTSQNALQPT